MLHLLSTGLRLAALAATVADPKVAGATVGAFAGNDVSARLTTICRRESGGCHAIGPHRIDAGWSTTVWAKAVKAGALDPERCSWHQLDEGPWSTSGPWGMMRAYTLRYLGGCAPAWVLDIPLVGAVAAARRMASWECRSVRRCARWAGMY